MSNIQDIETTSQDLLTTTEQNLTNLVLADNRPIMTDTTAIDQNSSTVSLSSTIDESSWDILKLASRPSVIITGTWSSTPGVPALIKLPLDLASAQSYWTTLFKIFNFARFDMNIRIQVNTTRFHSGRIAITWNPMSTYTLPSAGYPLIWRATQLPHVILDASMSNIAELHIPYQHYNDIMALNGGASASLGTLAISTLTGLNAASGSSPTANFTVWFWLSNVQMHTPIANHQPFAPPTAEPLLFAQSGIIEQKSMQIAEIGKAATSTINSAVQTGRGILKFMEVADNPALPTPATRTVLSNTCLAHGRAPTSNVRMSLDPISSVSHASSQNPTDVDEMHISNIIKVPTLLGVVDLSTTIKFSYPVTPTVTLDDSSNFYPSFMAYVSQRFRQWRGGLRVKFEFVCSNFHTGRFLVSFIPNVAATPVYPISTLNNYPSIVMDLQEKHSFEFVIPYTSPTPWKAVGPYSIQNAAESSLEYITGIMNFQTLNEISFPSSVSPFCQLWIYVSGAEDMEFAVPYVDITTPYFEPTRGLKTADFFPDPLPPVDMEEDFEHIPPPQDKLFAQSYVSTNRMDITSSENILNNSTSITPPLNPVFNEDFMHLKNILARSTISCYVTTTIGERNIYFILPSTPDRIVSSRIGAQVDTPSTDLITYFSQLFIFWRGSMRYNIISDITRVEPVMISTTVDYQTRRIGEAVDRSIAVWNYTGSIEPTIYRTYNLMQASPSHLSSAPMAPNVELETPYYSSYRKLPRRILPIALESYPETNLNSTGNLIVQYSNLALAHYFYIYTSSAPDFQLFTLGATPIVSKTPI